MLPAVCVDWRMNNVAKWANSSNNGAGEVDYDLLNGGEIGEYNGLGFVHISQIFRHTTWLVKAGYIFWRC